MKTINPNDSGRFCVESTEQIDINKLIRKFNTKAKESFIQSQIDIDGLNLQLTTSKTRYGLRLWFLCPKCNKRIGKLYKHPLTGIIACRTCNNLYYKSQKFKGMLEQKLI